MDENKHLNRVRQSAEAVAAILSAPSNFPLNEYIELEDARVVTAAMSIDPSELTSEDLERLLLVRDGLYNIVTEATDKGAEGEHSVELLINALSRLYVDFERAIKAQGAKMTAALDDLNALQSTASAALDRESEAVARVKSEANAVISQTNITNRTINISILNFDIGKVDVLRNLKIDISRLSASVFAIKMQFEAGVLFEGTIKFLNDGVDRILKDIAAFAGQLGQAYRSGTELLASITPLLEKGTRFVKLIGSFITGFFDGSHAAGLPEYRFTPVTGYKSRAITSAVALESGTIVLGGRGGLMLTANPHSKQVVPQAIRFRSDVRCLDDLRNGDLAVGTDEGLVVVGALTNKPAVRASYSERVDALATPHWGGLGSAIVTGASDGALRRWSLSGGLSQLRADVANRDMGQRLGRSIQSVIRWGSNVLVAAGEKIFVLDAAFEIEEEIQIDRKVVDMCQLSPETAIVVGTGFIDEVNLARGTFTRMLSVSPKSEYVAVGKLEEGVVVVGTAQGVVRAIDVKSGTEVGELNLDMVLRGLLVSGSRIYVYGGGWKSEGKSVVAVDWKKAQSL
ncbi:hypothetical protein [Rhizobium leguminosarum]|uniref:hypothetical protein n=1 Tax=Rhizobium leguminosarum TaxID=384 RepID=UPI001C93C9CB|nr:hypothetical protein [Rhizobium leguminosarum]MBY5609924.1 hypothetical protein [Rhizobium leguminosarum]MBY5657757.1 hypothetical protein [Rhizobium leguminosarum]